MHVWEAFRHYQSLHPYIAYAAIVCDAWSVTMYCHLCVYLHIGQVKPVEELHQHLYNSASLGLCNLAFLSIYVNKLKANLRLTQLLHGVLLFDCQGK